LKRAKLAEGGNITFSVKCGSD